MRYRDFKGYAISEAGLGTWQLGGADWGNVSKEQAFAILQQFVDMGGNFIDTADVYGDGRSESLIGEFLQTQSAPLYVATKLGRRQDGKYGWPQNFTYDALKRQVEDSLERLQVSRLFLEQLHCIPTEVMAAGHVFDHLRKLQQEGLILHFGASVETREEALICIEQEGLASLQIIFNLFRQTMADAFFRRAKERNVALIARVPLASGLLTGKLSETSRFPVSDHRNYNADGKAFNAGETFSGIEFHKGVQLSKEIAALLPDDRMAQWALRWILDYPEITTTIPGASKPEQVIANMKATELPPLSEKDHEKLKRFFTERIEPEIRGHW